MSLRSLARRLGVSHAAPANHFPDKAALFTAIAIEGFELLAAAIERATGQAPRPTDPRLRVGDAERGQVIDQLADHHAAGRLTLPEFEERMASAWTAQTGADGAGYRWPIWPMLGWGIGVAGHVGRVRDPRR